MTKKSKTRNHAEGIRGGGNQRGGIMKERSWRRNLGGEIMGKEQWRRNHWAEIREGKSGRGNHGGGIVEDESPRRHPGGSKRYPGGVGVYIYICISRLQ